MYGATSYPQRFPTEPIREKQRPGTFQRIVKAIFGVPAFTAITIALIVNIIVLLYALGVIPPAAANSSSILYLVGLWPPYLYKTWTISGGTFMGWSLFILFSIIASIVMILIRQGRDFFTSLIRRVRHFTSPPTFTDNPIYVIFQLFFATFFVSLATYSMVEMRAGSLAIVVGAIVIYALYYTVKRPTLPKSPAQAKQRGLTRTDMLFTPKNIILAWLIILFFTIIIVVISYIQQTPTTPVSDGGERVTQWRMLYGLANASVYEEIVTRILWLGLPLLVVHAVMGRVETNPLRYIFGGKIKIDGPAVAFLIISSVVFGLAHIGSWGYWKAIPTFAAGLAFGYLFLRYGIHAAIILHFLTDYLSAATLTLELGSFASIFFVLLYLVFLTAAIFIWVPVGGYFMLVYLLRAIEFFKRFGKRKPRRGPPSTPQDEEVYIVHPYSYVMEEEQPPYAPPSYYPQQAVSPYEGYR